MANLKSSIKSVKKTAKKTTRNRIIISTLKHTAKQARNNGDKKDLSKLYRKADSALAKGKITKNKANRIKSRIAKAANKNVKTAA
ncbi:MAG: 30S ribosomal protein S20 [Mycoplasmataceae bacterium]|jgi:small subunit ribosomal protein S20|nr:30S ribosomal protein S20 [Mycoplasmataceae bacterium]